MEPATLLWIAAALGAWWVGAAAAGLRRDVVRMETASAPTEDYALISLLRRFRDDPVALGLRLRFSRYFSAVFVPLALAAAVAGLSWRWTVVALVAGWLLSAAADAVGGGPWVRRTARLRGGALYGLWARITQPVVRPARPLLQLRTRPGDDDRGESLVRAESRAAMAAAGGRLGREERRILRRLLASTDILVADIMTPWERVARLEGEPTVPEAALKITESGHSRLPVLRDGKVMGLVTVKDLLPHVHGADPSRVPLGGLLHEAYFVEQERTVQEMLEELREAAVHLAVVLDRLGRHVGIVTMEDVLEEIVGELHDEREREAEEPRP